jgi:hypothetical protein
MEGRKRLNSAKHSDNVASVDFFTTNFLPSLLEKELQPEL